MQIKVISNPPFYICDLPKEIKKEVSAWVKECKKIKQHPLSYLKSHENVGYLALDGIKHNSYQCTIPFELVSNSFWLSYVLRVCAACWGGNHIDYRMRLYPGHFYSYDIWTNFSYQGDDNPIHQHSGDISGVIYHNNHDHPTIFPDHGTKYSGKNGTMILFDSNTRHCVDLQQMKKERITIAFNICKEIKTN